MVRILRFALSNIRICIQSAWIVSTGKDYNAWLRFRKLFHTKEEGTKEFEAGRWQLLELDHADPLSIRKKD